MLNLNYARAHLVRLVQVNAIPTRGKNDLGSHAIRAVVVLQARFKDEPVILML